MAVKYPTMDDKVNELHASNKALVSAFKDVSAHLMVRALQVRDKNSHKHHRTVETARKSRHRLLAPLHTLQIDRLGLGHYRLLFWR